MNQEGYYGGSRSHFSGAAPPPGRPADATASFVGEMLGAERKIEEDAGKLVRALEAIERDPKSAVAYYHLGILLEAIRGDEAGAETAYRKACELDPQYADAFINLGNLLKGDGILKGSEGVLQGVDRGRPE